MKTNTVTNYNSDLRNRGSIPQPTNYLDNIGNIDSSIKQTSQVRPNNLTNVVADRYLGEFEVGELVGEETTLFTGQEASGEVGLHDELGNGIRTAPGEEFEEATQEQLAAPESEEGAASDLKGIEGFADSESGEEGAEFNFGGLLSTITSLFESTEGIGSEVSEVGEAVEGSREEFFPILASLLPMLISSVGPALAKGVMNKLSKPTKAKVKRLAKTGVGLAGLVAKKLQESVEAGDSGESSDMELVDEASVIEAASQIESIIGKDTRHRIEKTTDQPWRHICALRIEFPSGKVYRGTGFFVGPRSVVTAGHCVYLHNQGGWAKKIMVIPAANGSSKPLGSMIASEFRSVGGWVKDKKPECDYGCIVLPSDPNFRATPGSFGFAAFDNAALLAKTAVLAGYPGDKPFAELWGDKNRIKTVTANTLIYTIDTMGGQSGAPVYIKKNGQRFVVGIHNYGGTTSNSATRITKDVYRRLYAWSKIGLANY